MNEDDIVRIPKDIILRAAQLRAQIIWNDDQGTWEVREQAPSKHYFSRCITPAMYRNSLEYVEFKRISNEWPELYTPPSGKEELHLQLERFVERTDVQESALQFYERVWGPRFDHSKVTPGLVRMVDEALYDALSKQKAGKSRAIRVVFPQSRAGRRPKEDPKGQLKREKNRLRAKAYRLRKRSS